jgi:non-heme chloroperoxidase
MLMKHIVRGAVAVPAIAAAIVGGILLFTAPKPPPPITAIQSAGDVMSTFAAGQPVAQYLVARDGTKLSFRFYPGKPGAGVVVAVHGSSGTTVAMHGVAQAISAEGPTVYSVDLRGHGFSKGPDGRLGDVVYRGQYEDDLADTAKFVASAHPSERKLLLGHSTGGAVILRTASIPSYAGNFDAYLALSPFIAPGSAMDRPNQGGWTSASVPRIVVLSILNGFGISALDHMTVLAMAVPDGEKDNRPGSYSHALLASANLPRDWEPAIGAIRKPTEVLIGEDDELFFAKAYPAELGRANSQIKVKLLPNVGHMGMVYQPEALKAVSSKAREMLHPDGQK